MARRRMIDHSLWTHERFMTLSVSARLLFIGLVSQADDEGRGRAHPISIKAALFPGDTLDPEEVTHLLAEVARAGLATVYEEGKYYALPGWKNHQTVNRPSPSKYPPPPPERLEEAMDSPQSPGIINEDSVRTHGGFSEDSWSAQPKGKGREGKGSEKKTPPSPSRGRGSASLSANAALFEQFWQAYPKKAAKPKALKAWGRLRPDDALFGVLMTGLERAKRSREWSEDGGAYIPHPATWINGRRWEDESDPSGAGVTTTTEAEKEMALATSRDLETIAEARDRWESSWEHRDGNPEKYLKNYRARFRTQPPHPPEVAAALRDLCGYIGAEVPC